MSHTLVEAPIGSITVEDGHNPRTTFNGEAMAELVASVKQHGIVQPLVVRPEGDGYVLIAGERRLRAAQTAKLKTVPVVVRDPKHTDSTALALIENLHRDDLSPIEEAQGYKRALTTRKKADLARQVGRPVARINERLKLLDLPEPVQEAIDQGTVPLVAAKDLLRIAGASARVAECLAALIAKGEVRADAAASSQAVGKAVTQAKKGKDGVFLVQAQSWGNVLQDAPWPKDFDLSAVEAAREAVEWENGTPAYLRSYSDPAGKPFSLDEDDTDAARAFGCLVESPDGYGKWVSDPAWLADRLVVKLKATAKAQKAAKKAREKAREGDAPDLSTVALSPEAQAARAERDAQEKAENERREKLLAEDRQFGQRVAKELASVTLTKDVGRLAAVAVVTHVDGLIVQRAMRALGRVEGQGDDVLAEALAWVDEAKTGGEYLGRIAQLLVLGRYADAPTGAWARSVDFPVDNDADWTPEAAAVVDGAVLAIDKLAEPVLTKAVRERERVERTDRYGYDGDLWGIIQEAPGDDGEPPEDDDVPEDDENVQPASDLDPGSDG